MSSSCPMPYCIKQGETRRPLFTVFTIAGDIQNLTGAIVELQVKPNVGDPDSELVISKVSPLSIEILDQTIGGDTEGQFVIQWNPADTVDVPGGQYAWDVVVYLPGGERSYVIDPSPFTVRAVVNQA